MVASGAATKVLQPPGMTSMHAAVSVHRLPTTGADGQRRAGGETPGTDCCLGG